VHESGRAEVVGDEDVFDEDADGTGENVQSIVESDETKGNEKGKESVEVGLRARVGMIAIDPEEADGARP